MRPHFDALTTLFTLAWIGVAIPECTAADVAFERIDEFYQSAGMGTYHESALDIEHALADDGASGRVTSGLVSDSDGDQLRAIASFAPSATSGNTESEVLAEVDSQNWTNLNATTYTPQVTVAISALEGIVAPDNDDIAGLAYTLGGTATGEFEVQSGPAVMDILLDVDIDADADPYWAYFYVANETGGQYSGSWIEGTWTNGFWEINGYLEDGEGGGTEVQDEIYTYDFSQLYLASREVNATDSCFPRAQFSQDQLKYLLGPDVYGNAIGISLFSGCSAVSE